MTTPVIVVLGRDTCEDTIRSRAWMDGVGIAYEYRNVEADAAANALIRSYNRGNVVTPTILVSRNGSGGAPARVLVEPSDEALAAAIAEVGAEG